MVEYKTTAEKTPDGKYQIITLTYGTIGDRIETRDCNGNKFLAITNSQGDYYMPESALAYVKRLTENARKSDTANAAGKGR